MSFTDHKITSFQHKIADLPDEPQIPAAELKSRFDACPEELRQSLNAVCDDAARLEARVEGIVVDTFGDTIDKEMLSDELAAELDGKATQSALDSTAAALDERLDAVETALPQKCEMYIGTYTGDGEDSQYISLGFAPKAIMTCPQAGNSDPSGSGSTAYGGLALPDIPAKIQNRLFMQIEENGFRVYGNVFSGNPPYLRANASGMIYFYWAIK